MGKTVLNRDFGRAAKVLSELAWRGNPDAQIMLGMMMLLGQGMDRDVEGACHYFEQALEQGHPSALELLISAKTNASQPLQHWKRKRTGRLLLRHRPPELLEYVPFPRTNQMSVADRLQSIERFGSETLDILRIWYHCSRCNQVIEGTKTVHLPTVNYRDLEEAV